MYIFVCFWLDIKLFLNMIGIFCFNETYEHQSHKPWINIMIGYGWLNGATHTYHGRQRDGYGWLNKGRTHAWQKQGYAPFPLSHVFVSPFIGVVPRVCPIHVVCGAHSSSCTPLLFEWRTHTHNMDGRDNGTARCIGVAHMYDREKGTYPFPLLSMCLSPFNQPYPLVSFIHAACGAHSTFHTPPPVK